MFKPSVLFIFNTGPQLRVSAEFECSAVVALLSIHFGLPELCVGGLACDAGVARQLNSVSVHHQFAVFSHPFQQPQMPAYRGREIQR